MIYLIKNLITFLSKKEKKIIYFLTIIFALSLILRFIIFINENSKIIPIQGSKLIEGLIGQPIIINPILSNNQVDLNISYLIYLPIKDLIETYETENNSKTHIIILKENIFWSDNTPITIDDVIFTLNLIQKNNLNYLNYNWKEIEYEKISKIKIKFYLNEKESNFKNIILKVPILPNHIFNEIPLENIKYSDYNLKPISSGPYVFDSFKIKKNGFIKEYILKINEKYYKEKPYIKKIIFKFFNNENELIEAFKLKKINAFFIPPFSKENEISKTSKIEIINIPYYYVIYLNQQNNSLFKNKDFRKALNLAINKEEIIDKLFYNSLNFNQSYFKTDLSLDFNLEIAQKLINNLKEKKLSFSLIVPEDIIFEKIVETIKNQWLKLDPLIEIKIIKVKDQELKEIIKNRNYEALIYNQKIEDNNFYPFYHSSQKNYPNLNINYYENKILDKQLLDFNKTNEQETKNIILNEIKKNIKDDSNIIYLFQLPYYYVYHNKLKKPKTENINKFEERFDNILKWHFFQARVLK